MFIVRFEMSEERSSPVPGAFRFTDYTSASERDATQKAVANMRDEAWEEMHAFQRKAKVLNDMYSIIREANEIINKKEFREVRKHAKAVKRAARRKSDSPSIDVYSDIDMTTSDGGKSPEVVEKKDKIDNNRDWVESQLYRDEISRRLVVPDHDFPDVELETDIEDTQSLGRVVIEGKTYAKPDIPMHKEPTQVVEDLEVKKRMERASKILIDSRGAEPILDPTCNQLPVVYADFVSRFLITPTDDMERICRREFFRITALTTIDSEFLKMSKVYQNKVTANRNAIESYQALFKTRVAMKFKQLCASRRKRESEDRPSDDVDHRVSRSKKKVRKSRSPVEYGMRHGDHPRYDTMTSFISPQEKCELCKTDGHKALYCPKKCRIRKHFDYKPHLQCDDSN
jgi:hypothetical protein